MQELLLFFNHHSTLSLAFVIVLFLLLILEWLRLRKQAQKLTPLQVTQLINHENAVVIDLRSAETYKSGHIIDALSFPFNEILTNSKKIDKFKTRPLVIAANTTHEEQKITAQLSKDGFRTYLIKGGMRAWMLADLPVVKGT